MRGISIPLFLSFFPQMAVIGIALNCAPDFTDYKEFQYLSDSLIFSKELTIHFSFTPSHMSTLIFFQLPPEKVFAEPNVAYMPFCLHQHPLHTFNMSKGSTDVHCTISLDNLPIT